ncbi:nuclear transport factor 2 family protein [Sphingobium fluviale]|jgi:ketosteroid isomerase-like protein|uniref:Ketosteroid isomerase n=1 Tax=Sphingobium fluviale TaxID=2506423 RepID=A0A4Q1KM41_9SPHN|nr:nuclear transport factor 2 family protein [Sphingobium fluviale]RXR30772.1 ketosteroid isomerase [Sphingobium fluviale]
MIDNSDFVRSLYEAFGRGDVQTILDNVDPAIEWVSNGNHETIPWGGKRDGEAGVASFFQALGDNLDFEMFEQHQFCDAGNVVTVLGRSRAQFKTGGRGIFDSDWAHIFTIEGGQLTRFQEFYDTAAIEQARSV